MSDPEPRRSVRSTKGQHKSLDQLDQPVEPKKRGRKTGKKAEEKQDDTEEEIIRCVCGATEQDGDPDEPWIACDKCTAWQHNVCMGMSVYSEDLAKDYFCEQCKPENHKELLEGMARGEKPWEERRHQHEEEKARDKRKKGGRKGKGKRNSDAKEGSAKPSPGPEARKDAKGVAGSKRKSIAGSEEPEGKKRKISESEAIPVYNPPDDLPGHISDLAETRQTPAKGLYKVLAEILGKLLKKGDFTPENGATADSVAERFAIQIERAVFDAHPAHREYGHQIRTLGFNLKQNADLTNRLLRSTLTPPMLAVMTSDDLASKELQQKTAKMKAQAERQSILTAEEGGPRLRRTHKGEELVEKDNATLASEEKPSALRRQSAREASAGTPQTPGSSKNSETPGPSRQRQPSARGGLQIDTQNESGKTDFDIKKVFSSVRSPSTSHQRRPSQPVPTSGGPGVDPEVDRMLQDDGYESPPYSPTEETDPDIVWRGDVSMNTVANFQATARHVGGVNLSKTINLPWSTLIPKKLTVAGRIDEQIATEYLCSLRYSAPTDITVTSLTPASDAAQPGFLALIDYFTSRKRYGVVGEKGVGNVRDTYLVPVQAGTNNHPEFMLNLEDNFIPASRAAPMLLLVVVYRNDAAAMEQLRGPNWAGQFMSQPPAANSPTPASTASAATRQPSIASATPAFSPTTPQLPVAPIQPAATPVAAAAAPAQVQPTPTPAPAPVPTLAAAPVPVPAAAHAGPPAVAPAPGHHPMPVTPAAAPPATAPAAAATAPGASVAAPVPHHHNHPVTPHAVRSAATAKEIAQREGEASAKEVLGPLATCSTATFLMSQAAIMQKNEWELVRSVFEKHPQTQKDLAYLRHELEKYRVQQTASAAARQQPPAQTPVPIPRVPHTVISPRPAAAPPSTATVPGTTSQPQS